MTIQFYYIVFYFIFFLAAVVPAIMIVLASYAGCDRLLVVTWFTLAMGFMGTFYPGMKVNPLDLSPNYAGSLMAVTNGIGALAGVASPSFVGFMAPDVCMPNCMDVFQIISILFNFFSSKHWHNGESYFGLHSVFLL